MTQNEIDTIVAQVLAALKTNSKTIEQLPEAQSVSVNDCLELSSGKKVRYSMLRDLIAAYHEANNTTNGHTHNNLTLLNSLALVGAYLYISTGGYAEKISAGYADEAGTLRNPEEFIAKLTPLFLSKTGDDIAQGIITFLKGIVSEGLINANGGAEFGTFKAGLTDGTGANIDSNGNAELQSLKVRGSATFMELIINRLSAIESEFNFTDTGTIEKVTLLEDKTYLLNIRKRWDYDFTPFAENDVVYGSINTLLADGSIKTSWFRVLAVDTSANTLTVVTYPNSEVPGGVNYAPVAGMNIARRGNALNEDRQSCWYISSFEGVIMYMEGVTKPIPDESNYYMSLGKPKHLELYENLPINYGHPYIFARGAIIQDLLRIDYKGNQIYEIVDLGLWSATQEYIRGYSEEQGSYIQHQCWYKSCCWRCIADKAQTGVAPRWNNTDWVCVVGDSNYSLDIQSSKGHFFRIGKEYTTLSYLLKHGDMDISADAWQVQWTRESGLDSEDLLWNKEHADCAETCDITSSDMPSNWYTQRSVIFRCTVYLKDGADETELTAEFNIS